MVVRKRCVWGMVSGRGWTEGEMVREYIASYGAGQMADVDIGDHRSYGKIRHLMP